MANKCLTINGSLIRTPTGLIQVDIPTVGTKSIVANGTYNAVDDSLDGYSAVTVDVPTGGDEPVGSGFRVRFIDYDGTILKTEYVDSGNNATPPELPTHANLTFKEWGNPYTNVTRNIDTGAFYQTTPGDDSIYLDIYLDSITGLSVEINAKNSINGGESLIWSLGVTELHLVRFEQAHTHMLVKVGTQLK